MFSLAPRYTASVDQVSEPEWSESLSNFDDASIYQTWSYGAIHWGKDQLSHLVLRRDATVVAVAQFRIVRIPVFGPGIAYLRWGPLHRSRGETWEQEVLRQMTLAIKQEYANRRKLVLRLIPNVYDTDLCYKDFEACWRELGLAANARIKAYTTARVDLALPLDVMRKKLHQRWRNRLTRAEKAGYTVVEGDTEELFGRFCSLYHEMMARKQFETSVAIDEFREIQHALPRTQKMHVKICEKGSTPLNALVSAPLGDTGIYLFAATSNAGLSENGAFLLQWKMMEYLRERGCRWYDLGGINPDRNPGVYQFKSGMGGEEARQMVPCELTGSWASAFCVRIGEALKACLARRTSIPQGSGPRN